MGWNYRVVRKNGELGIHEAYYDENGRIWAITERAVSPFVYEGACETVENLRTVLRRMVGAIDKPVLDYDSIPEADARPPGMDGVFSGDEEDGYDGP